MRSSGSDRIHCRNQRKRKSRLIDELETMAGGQRAVVLTTRESARTVALRTVRRRGQTACDDADGVHLGVQIENDSRPLDSLKHGSAPPNRAESTG